MTHSSRQKVVQSNPGVVLVLVASVAVFLLYRFPPDRYSFYPLCPIHEYLHIECPGCGATRALSALLHGNFVAALHFNAFAILVVLPLTVIYAAICVKRTLRSERFRYPVVPLEAIAAVTVFAAAFTVFRNV